MIRFEIQDAPFVLQHKIAIKNWIKEILSIKNERVGEINYILSNDDCILEINRRFLGHDFYTDIITFDTSGYDEEVAAYEDRATPRKISGDIYISLDTVDANAREYSVSFTSELYRVMIHGILHLTGIDDQTPEEFCRMKEEEDKALELFMRINGGVGLPPQRYASAK